MQRYHTQKLVYVNFECHRRCSRSLSLLFSVKPKKSQSTSNGPCLESNLSPLCLRISFLPLSHWDIISKSKKIEWDTWFFILSVELPIVLLFLFNCFLSLRSLEVSLQIFESKIDQKSCCITPLLKKRTSTQQRRFMNTN